MHAMQPIGIFDSGIGGLTVTQAVVEQLPHENIIYFGDTAHLPYGDKSAQTIITYCKKIVDFLLSKDCKIILIACNSAAAAAYSILVDYIQQKALLISVIEPVVDYVAKHYHQKQIGLIGTRQTVNSEIFLNKFKQLPNQLMVKSLATPLLVPLIEENFHQHDVLVDQILALYLQQEPLRHIDALILACTHYPLLKERISAFYQHKIPVLDAGLITANALKNLLQQQQLMNPQAQTGTRQFYVSDLTPAFAQMADYFFGTRHIRLETVDL